MNKVFGARRAATDRSQLSFDVGDETFVVELPLPGFTILDLAAISQKGSEQEAVTALGGFFGSIFTEADYQRLRDACNRARLPLAVSAEEPGEDSVIGIMHWLIEQASGHPTKQLSASPESPSSDTSGSPAAATSQG